MAIADATNPVLPRAQFASVSDHTSISDDAAQSPVHSKPNLSLEDHFIDEPRRLRVAVIGGGLAGILAGILFPAKVPGINLVIYEKNKDVVCLDKPVASSKTNWPRGALGSRMCIPESAVTFQPMFTNPPSRPILSGLNNLLVARKSEITGKGLPDTIMSMKISSLSTRSKT